MATTLMGMGGLEGKKKLGLDRLSQGIDYSSCLDPPESEWGSPRIATPLSDSECGSPPSASCAGTPRHPAFGTLRADAQFGIYQ